MRWLISALFSVKRRRPRRACRGFPIAACFVLGILILAAPHSSFAQQTKILGAKMVSFQVGQDVYVRSLALDPRRESLWVGTSVGVLEIDIEAQEVKQTFTRDHGLASEYVFAIGIAPNGDVWFGTNAGGVSRYRDGQWKTYFPMHGLADYWAYAFAFPSDGTVWIGTWNGASHFDPSIERFTNYREELINIWVYGIGIDAEERIWFGTEGGVSMLEDSRWLSWTNEDGLGAPNSQELPSSTNTGLGTKSRHDLGVVVGSTESYNPNYVFSVQVDRLGRGVWFGTWGGGVSLRGFDGTWQSYNVSDGLAGNIVYSIAQAEDGTLWFGTNHGLSKFDGSDWVNYRHGLPSPDVYAITLGGGGQAWVGTKGAVTLISSNE